MELVKFSFRHYFRWSVIWLFIGVAAAIFSGLRELFPQYAAGDCPLARVAAGWMELIFWGGLMPIVSGLWLIRLGEIRREDRPVGWLFLWEGASVLWQAALLWGVLSAAFGLRRSVFGWSWFSPVYGLFGLALLLIFLGVVLNIPYVLTPRHRVAISLYLLSSVAVQFFIWSFLYFGEPPDFSELLFFGAVFNGLFLPMAGWLLSFSEGAEYSSVPDISDYFLLWFGPWSFPIISIPLMSEYKGGGWSFWLSVILSLPLIYWCFRLFTRRGEFFRRSNKMGTFERWDSTFFLMVGGFWFGVGLLFLMAFHLFRLVGISSTTRVLYGVFLFLVGGSFLFIWAGISKVYVRYFVPVLGGGGIFFSTLLIALAIYLLFFLAISSQLAVLGLLAFIPRGFSVGNKLLLFSEFLLLYPAWVILWIIWRVYLENFSGDRDKKEDGGDIRFFVGTEYYP